MPRWKALPEELDPEIREFARQMRQLVDRSGLSLAAVSDRTGYSKTSWERYLNGRLLPPQGAVSALAEVTGTDVRHLATMWELAERAWSRAEMRHDMTMEAIRISQAREALASAGKDSEGGKKSRGWDRGSKAKAEKPAKPAKQGKPAEPPAPPPASSAPPAPPAPPAPSGPDLFATPHRSSGEDAERADSSGHDTPAWAAKHSQADDADRPDHRDEAERTAKPEPTEDARPVTDASPSDTRAPASAREDTPARAPVRIDKPAAARGDSIAQAAEGGPFQRADRNPFESPFDDGPETPRADEDGDEKADGDARGEEPEVPPRPEWTARLSGVPAGPPPGFESTTVLRRPPNRQTPQGASAAGAPGPYGSTPAAAAGAAGTGGGARGFGGGPPEQPGPTAGGRPPSKRSQVAMVLAGAVGALAVVGAAVFFLDIGDESTAASPSPSPSATSPKLPDGVKCTGADCKGEDPELMGCGGQYAETTSDAMVGSAYIEVRYSEVCNAAWARIGGAAPGSTVTVDSAGESEDDEVADDSGGYTKMVAAKSAKAAKACVETAGGATGCTTP